MNVIYAYMVKGRNQQEVRELDLLLAPTPALKEQEIDRANMEAMRQLGDIGQVKPVPLPGKRRRPISG